MKTKLLILSLLFASLYKVGAQCLPSFSFITNGNVTTLTNNSTPAFLAGNIITYSIDFGDGTPLVLNTFPGMTSNHQYAANGLYTIVLQQTITDSITNIINCTANFTSNVTISNPISCSMNPTITFAGNANNINAIDFITTPNITGMPPGFAYGISIAYDYGDGSSGNSPTHIYTATGNYNAIATISIHDPNVPANVYCTQSVAVTVPFVYTNPCNNLPTFNLNAISNNVYSITNINPAIYQNGYIYSYQIDYGDGNVVTPNYLLNTYTHFYPIIGNYNVCITRTITDSITNTVLCTNTICSTAIVTTNVPPYTGCDANFTMQPDSVLGNLSYKFNGDISTTAIGSISSFAWDFGDGTSGTGVNPSHTYATTGVYNVCLTITTTNACTDVTCFNVSVQNNAPNSYWLTGNVFQSYNANLIPVSGAIIYLIKFEPVSQELHLVQSTAPAIGSGYGFQVPPGDYLVKAAPKPDNIQLSSYLAPTYNLNQLIWSNANTNTVVNASVSNVDIVLQQGLNAGGPGFISGAVIMGANKTTAVGDPKEGLTVLLVKNANNKLYTYTTTDQNGEYSFQNIPVGTYKVYIEELGKTMSFALVDITVANPTFLNIDFESNTGENHPLQSLASSLLIKNGTEFILSPNPSAEYLNMRFNEATIKNVQIEIVSLEGKVVYSSQREITTNEMQLNISSLNKGYYFLKAIIDKKVCMKKFYKL